MKYEEYESKINAVLSNPDTALASIGPVLEEIKKDTTALEEAMHENESLSARIRDLQDTNMKLYLMQTGEAAEEEVEEEPKTGMAAVEEFVAEIFKEEEED